MARVDPDLLTRAISNVLRNAVEANGEGGKVVVTAACHRGFWTAEILDEGAGIPRENLHRIFEPFFTTRSKGTGLGLAYASQVIRYQGGAIGADNRKTGGARFVVEIPIAAQVEEPTDEI
jgi:signal transduction histidine kinase